MAFAQFVFAMTDALVNQLVARFAITRWSPLNPSEVETQFKIEDRDARGVYLLGRGPGGDVPTVYVGQSNSALYDRLSRHAKFLQDRFSLPYAHVWFKALGVIIFDSVALEERLIAEYKTRWSKDDPLSGWNGSGIGSNDTGGRRDMQKPSGFDRRYPIDITLAKPNLLAAGEFTAKQLFNRLKNSAPYTIRIAPTQLGVHPDLQNTKVLIQNPSATVRRTLDMLLANLPSVWSVQVDPVRILLQRHVEIPPGALVNPETWPPEQWLAGEHQTVILRKP
ncbi:MAG: hypothetical protein ACLPWF_15450 [Bryobacteraceae bacterium]